jgi:hypothetical protein
LIGIIKKTPPSVIEIPRVSDGTTLSKTAKNDLTSSHGPERTTPPDVKKKCRTCSVERDATVSYDRVHTLTNVSMIPYSGIFVKRVIKKSLSGPA